MSNKSSKQAFGPTINRIADLMAHTNRYAFCGVSRLAADAKVSPSSISRLINGKMNPSFAMIARVTSALETTTGYKIDPRDLIAELGRFPTTHVCKVANCQGCLPENATDEFGDLKPSFTSVKPGKWVTSKYPRGFVNRQKRGDK